MKEKKRIIIIILIVLANLLLAGGWFYLSSQISLQKEIKDETLKELALIEAKIKNKGDLKLILPETKDEREKINSAFLNDQEVINFIEVLEDISEKSKSNLEISSIKKENDTRVFNIVISGPFKNVLQYIMLLENTPYQPDILRANMNIDQEKELWNARLNIGINNFVD